MTKKEEDKLKIIKGRIERGSIADQKAWRFIREMNSFSEERLSSIALIDGKRKYTYRQLFRSWDRYAEVFAALGITEQNGSRVGMTGNVSSECIIAFYALNMLGVSVSMLPVEESRDEKRWCETIRKEGITDLLIAGTYAWPGQLRILAKNRDDLGIRNAIVLPTYVDGRYAAPIERLQAKFYEPVFRMSPDVKIMDELFDKYETTPFAESRKRNDEAAVITHTSGTTKGIHKPIPLSDLSMNSAAVSFMKHELISLVSEGAVTAMKQLVDIFLKGGPVMWPILALSVIGEKVGQGE